uniref:(northern house mosquito) hypothetical protein n=1 Tax=Culex pipiens TaxID=7175 RepID=A0A8D8C4V9_CULPI
MTADLSQSVSRCLSVGTHFFFAFRFRRSSSVCISDECVRVCEGAASSGCHDDSRAEPVRFAVPVRRDAFFFFRVPFSSIVVSVFFSLVMYLIHVTAGFLCSMICNCFTGRFVLNCVSQIKIIIQFDYSFPANRGDKYCFNAIVQVLQITS